MFYFEVFESSIEAVSVRAGCHETYVYGGVVLKPGISHHDVFLVIERIEYFHGIQSSYRFNPYVRNRLVQCDDAPVGGFVGDYGAQVEFPVYKLNACLDVVLVINAQHQAGLVETGFIISGHFYLDLKFASVSCVIERSIIYGKTIV